MSTTEETATKEKTNVKFSWSTAAGYITSAVIILAMLILNWCGVISIKNIDTACAYTKESVKLVSMTYFQASKDQAVPAKTKEIVDSVLASIASTTEQLKTGKVDLSDAKTFVLTEVDKAIDKSSSKNPDLAKKLAHIMIEAGFRSIETYSTDILQTSGDYVKLLNAISTGIQEGYKIVYPDAKTETKPVEVKKTVPAVKAVEKKKTALVIDTSYAYAA